MSNSIDQQRQRVEQEMTRMVDDLDRSVLRKMQVNFDIRHFFFIAELFLMVVASFFLSHMITIDINRVTCIYVRQNAVMIKMQAWIRYKVALNDVRHQSIGHNSIYKRSLANIKDDCNVVWCNVMMILKLKCHQIHRKMKSPNIQRNLNDVRYNVWIKILISCQNYSKQLKVFWQRDPSTYQTRNRE